MAALRQLRGALFGPVVDEHRGRILKSLGDGWLVEFPPISYAVTCGIAIQTRLIGHDLIRLRIGIRPVEVCFEADDVFGEGVNVAARLGGHIRSGARGRASGPEQAGCAGRGPNPFSQDDEGPRLNPLNPTGRPPCRPFTAVGEDFRGVCGPARPTARIPPRRPRMGARRGAPDHAGLGDRTARYPQPRGLGRLSRRLPAQFRAPRRRVAGKLAGGDRDSRRRLGVAANRGDALPLGRSREGVAHGSPICGAREDPSSHRAHQSRRRGRDRSRGGYAMNAEARGAATGPTLRPRRSFIFTPGLKPEMYPKALASGADIVCVELEDGIAPRDKAAARANALALFAEPQADDGVERIVRINSLREAFGLADLQAVLATDTPPPALMLPKIRSPEEIVLIDDLLTERGHATRLHVIVETNRGLEAAEEIARCSGWIDALFFGGVDMAADLRCDNAWEPLLSARSRVVHAAAAAGLEFDRRALSRPAGPGRHGRCGAAGKVAGLFRQGCCSPKADRGVERGLHTIRGRDRPRAPDHRGVRGRRLRPCRDRRLADRAPGPARDAPHPRHRRLHRRGRLTECMTAQGRRGRGGCAGATAPVPARGVHPHPPAGHQPLRCAGVDAGGPCTPGLPFDEAGIPDADTGMASAGWHSQSDKLRSGGGPDCLRGSIPLSRPVGWQQKRWEILRLAKPVDDCGIGSG